jgi:maltooligosyltrehalose trehalohydrolase
MVLDADHDQVGNRPFGDRLHHDINADRYAVASALMLFAPETPMLFMGQEFAASTPFLYFTDHPEELGKLVTEGRRQEFSGFNIFDDPALRESIPDPQAESTFLSSKLRLEERERNTGILELYRQLLALRRDDDVLKHNDRMKSHASAISAELVAVHRWWGMQQRLLLANFGPELELKVRDIEAFAPVYFRPWNLMLSTTDEAFGGSGEAPVLNGVMGDRIVTVPARSALIFKVGH